MPMLRLVFHAFGLSPVMNRHIYFVSDYVVYLIGKTGNIWEGSESSCKSKNTGQRWCPWTGHERSEKEENNNMSSTATDSKV